MGYLIRPLADGDVDQVVEFSLRAWQPVFTSFERVLGTTVYLQVYPDWRHSQADVASPRPAAPRPTGPGWPM